MNCRQAHKLMDEVLDGTLTHQAELESHLGECRPCRAEWARLQQTQQLLAESARAPLEHDRLERLTETALARVQAQSAASQGAARPRRWVAIPAAVALAFAFAVGVCAGRTAWPREVRLREVVIKTRTVEKPVEVAVEVPVVEERVVIERVPVVKTRIVYRDRPATAEQAGQLAPQVREAAPELRAPGGIQVIAVLPALRREIEPAAVVEGPLNDADAPGTPDGPQPNAGADRPAELAMMAQTTPILASQLPVGALTSTENDQSPAQPQTGIPEPRGSAEQTAGEDQ